MYQRQGAAPWTMKTTGHGENPTRPREEGETRPHQIGRPSAGHCVINSRQTMALSSESGIQVNREQSLTSKFGKMDDLCRLAWSPCRASAQGC